MASVPDLVRQSKHDAQFFSNPQYTQHIYHVSKGGQRKVEEKEQWTRKKALGRGSFGAVYLEECVRGSNEGKVCAVKEIQKPEDSNYYRELEAVALFSYKQVSMIAPLRSKKQQATDLGTPVSAMLC